LAQPPSDAAQGRASSLDLIELGDASAPTSARKTDLLSEPQAAIAAAQFDDPGIELVHPFEPAPPAEPEADRRLEALLETVRRVFAEKGFGRASMQDLARAAEMSAGNFYRYFPSKDAIIETMVRRELLEIEKQFEHVMVADDPLSMLRALLHDQLNDYDRHDCAIWVEVLASAHRQEAISALYQDMMRAINGYLVRAFARACDMPIAESEARFSALAEMIFMLVQGVKLSRLRHDGPIPSSVLALSHQALDQYLAEISASCASWRSDNS
jgi:AcrR family transcriptional regulator